MISSGMLRDGVIGVGDVHVLSEFMYMNVTAPIVQKPTTFINYNTDLCKDLQRRVSSSSPQKFIFKWLKKVMLLFYEMKIGALKRQRQNVTVSNSTNAGPRTKYYQ